MRAVTALLLAACIGGAAMAWHYHAEAAQQMIAEWAPLFARKSSQPSEKTGLTAQPVLAAADVGRAEYFTGATGAPGAGRSRKLPAAPQLLHRPLQPLPAAAETAAPAAAAPEPGAVARDDGARSCQRRPGDRAAQGHRRAAQGQPAATRCDGFGEVLPRRTQRAKKPAPPPRPVAALAPARTPAPPPCSRRRSGSKPCRQRRRAVAADCGTLRAATG